MTQNFTSGPVTMRDFLEHEGTPGDPGRYVGRLTAAAQDAFAAWCKGTKYWHFRPDDAFIDVSHRLVAGDESISYADCFGPDDLPVTKSVIAGTVAELARRQAEAFPESEAAPAARFRVIVATLDGASPAEAERFARMVGEIVGGRG